MLAAVETQLGPPPASRATISPEFDSDEEADMIVVIPEIFKLPSESTVCRICLITEGRMERVTEKYEVAYSEVTGLKWVKTDSLPQHICWECSHRLVRALRVKQTALTAHNLLLDLRSGGAFLTLNDIKLIDRSYHQLTSKLGKKHFPPNEYISTHKQTTQHTRKPEDVNIEIKALLNTQKEYADTFENVDENIDDSLATIVKHVRVNRDSDDSSDCLIIDDAAIEAVGNVDKGEGMPIDDLIEIYNNDEDGDGRLQELNERFGEKSPVQLDQYWGVQGPMEGMASMAPLEQDAQEINLPGKPKKHTSLRVPRLIKISEAYAKLDRTIFTVTPVSEREQIAEVLKRQETFRFKSAPFKCLQCFRSFQCCKPYNMHMLRHDAAIGDYECTICHSRQKSPRAMKTHMHALHTVRIACKLCAFVTMNRSVARGHGRMHAGTIYRCPHCPSKFTQETTYKSHLRTLHVHAFVCSLCGYTYVSAKGLAVHRCKRHADADKIPLRGPNCDTCQVRFVSEEAYSRHLKLSSRHMTDNAPSLIELRMAGN